jgi:hypothetical protein
MSLLTFRASCAFAAVSLLVATTPAHADEPASPAPQVLHVERNSLPMMFTGIGLLTLGVVATGIGIGAMTVGKLDCQNEYVHGTTQRVPVAECRNDSVPINGGVAAVIGGSTFSVIGLGLTIAGAWKVTVPTPTATTLSGLRVGVGTVGFGGSF